MQARVLGAIRAGEFPRTIGLRLGMTSDTVRAHLALARKKLRHAARAARGSEPVFDDETPAQARRRIADGIRRHERCPRCHLVLPCGHEEITVGALAVKRRPVDVL